MELNPAGCEYVTYPTVDQTAPIEVSYDDGATWHATETVTGGVRILIAGPDCEAVGSALVLPIGTHLAIARMIDEPETVIRRTAGSIRIR